MKILDKIFQWVEGVPVTTTELKQMTAIVREIETACVVLPDDIAVKLRESRPGDTLQNITVDVLTSHFNSKNGAKHQ